MPRCFPALAALAILLASGIEASASDNWPQWRGPHQNGVSDSTDLPLTWSADENVVWKTALPSFSGGTPIIWGDRIFVTSPSAVTEEELKEHEAEQKRLAEERSSLPPQVLPTGWLEASR